MADPSADPAPDAAPVVTVPDGGVTPRAPEGLRAQVGPDAHVVAWALLAVGNAVAIATARPRPPLAVRAQQHLFDAGQLVAVGCVIAIALWALRRFVKRSWVGWAVAAVVSMALGAVSADEDVIGPLSRALGPARADLAKWPVAACLGLSIVACAGATERIARRPLGRWLAFAAGLAAGAAQNFVLKADYRGAHTLLGAAAAVTMGVALSHASAPRLLSGRSAPPGRSRLATAASALRAAIALVALATLVVPPKQRVRQAIFSVDGAIVAPLLLWQDAEGSAQVNIDSEWFRRRDNTPDIPPSGAPLVAGTPLVVMVTIDSMRGELMTDARHNARLPTLMALEAESTSFRQARSSGSGTVVTFSTVFTGKHHFMLRWAVDGRELSEQESSVRFSELLQRAGVRTETVTSYPPLAFDGKILRGFDRGAIVPPPEGQDFALSDGMVDAAIAALADVGDTPTFFFMHLMDPHSPYDSATRSGSAYERYVAEISRADAALARLIDALKQRGVWDRTILIVGADHGEGFNKHKIPFHNIGLYEEILHVPLIIRVPGGAPRIVEQPVSLIDLGPTILDLFGQPTPGAFMGQSLVPFLRGEAPTLTRPIVGSTLFKSNAFYSFPKKVIVDRKKRVNELYDLSSDPDERDNQADEPDAAALSGALDALIRAHKPRR